MKKASYACTHMYAARYHSAVDVAQFLALHHGSLLRRILAWQEVIYSDASLPGWLQDSLINVLHLITEDSVQMTKRMAEAVGETEFAQRCGQWLEQGSRSLEEKLWAGSRYLSGDDALVAAGGACWPGFSRPL